MASHPSLILPSLEALLGSPSEAARLNSERWYIAGPVGSYSAVILTSQGLPHEPIFIEPSRNLSIEEIRLAARVAAQFAVLTTETYFSVLGGSPDWLPGPYITEAAALLHRIGQLRTGEYDEEPRPSEAVIEKISALIRDAGDRMHGSMPDGIVSTFYGELNVTWRRDNEIVRLACFPNRPTILQYGNLSQPLNPYQSLQNPSADDVASHLAALINPAR
jgi:hypothetical protein